MQGYLYSVFGPQCLKRNFQERLEPPLGDNVREMFLQLLQVTSQLKVLINSPHRHLLLC
ncbi:hypothetical protein IHE45_17G091700 [Dioscorea alata]|uniref:Uncharacterized protein n=2 Tax=Dioscorea alata TaxID=55571 RepID=A0ACB7UDY8_DIOAL|nr:hypothetical protein IHE45_17G091700 [Dioscorea alata]KAH7658497.1 hypothetical protein IHE45_17G091700 [Dioscorea alata]